MNNFINKRFIYLKASPKQAPTGEVEALKEFKLGFESVGLPDVLDMKKTPPEVVKKHTNMIKYLAKNREAISRKAIETLDNDTLKGLGLDIINDPIVNVLFTSGAAYYSYFKDNPEAIPTTNKEIENFFKESFFKNLNERLNNFAAELNKVKPKDVPAAAFLKRFIENDPEVDLNSAKKQIESGKILVTKMSTFTNILFLNKILSTDEDKLIKELNDYAKAYNPAQYTEEDKKLAAQKEKETRAVEIDQNKIERLKTDPNLSPEEIKKLLPELKLAENLKKIAITDKIHFEPTLKAYLSKVGVLPANQDKIMDIYKAHKKYEILLKEVGAEARFKADGTIDIYTAKEAKNGTLKSLESVEKILEDVLKKDPDNGSVKFMLEIIKIFKTIFGAISGTFLMEKFEMGTEAKSFIKVINSGEYGIKLPKEFIKNVYASEDKDVPKRFVNFLGKVKNNFNGDNFAEQAKTGCDLKLKTLTDQEKGEISATKDPVKIIKFFEEKLFGTSTPSAPKTPPVAPETPPKTQDTK